MAVSTETGQDRTRRYSESEWGVVKIREAALTFEPPFLPHTRNLTVTLR